MKKLLLTTLLSVISITALFAQNDDHIGEVVVTSTKETNDLRKLPTAITILSPGTISLRGIESLKDINTIVPNLYIPDYGSRMSTPIYLRGIGTRSSSQSVGIYVDGIPYMDKSTFDFELMDIQRIEILRGPQGTLYGRNAMGGIMNIYTRSPLEYRGTQVTLSGGNYNKYSAKASHYAPIGRNTGIAVGAYYDRSGGYFTNQFDGKKVDKEQSAGGNIKFDAKLSNRLTMRLSTAFDYTDQGAFPYGLYHDGTIDDVDYNDEGSYRRSMSNNSLRFEYLTNKIMLTSSTGYQFLDDNMMMDQDFSPKSIFTINQRQKQHSINQEFAIRSIDNSRYQWSVGLFGFHNDMRTVGDVTFKQDGIANILQPIFDGMMPPHIPISIKIDDTTIPNPGIYKTPTTGIALFHQSTINNLFTEGLSLTAGVRFDYEKQKLNYDTSIEMNVSVTAPSAPMPIPMTLGKTLTGDLEQEFFQFTPKIALSYEINNMAMVYATASKGYKAGGYNNQMFSEIIQDSMKSMRPPGMPPPTPTENPEATLEDVLSYRPEVTWNYEVGTRFRIPRMRMSVEAAAFYMDVTDLQLTKFVNGGSGRILTNSGRGRSYGAELSLQWDFNRWMLSANYGYTNAKFTNYDGGEDKDGTKVDYTGNYIPYTPQHTFSVGAGYNFHIYNSFISNIALSANYNGCSDIYWTEKNDIKQPFYGLLNAKVSIIHRKNCVRLDLWANNITSVEYGAFYFESFNKSFMQKGRPFTFGANLTFMF